MHQPLQKLNQHESDRFYSSSILTAASVCLLAAFCLSPMECRGFIAPPQLENFTASSEVHLKGIAIVGDDFPLNIAQLAEIGRVYMDPQLSLPGSFDVMESRLADLFLNQEITQSTLLMIRNEILAYYYEHGRHAVYVEIPEQDVTDGIVVCQVRSAKVNKVSYEGNRWFSEQKVAKKIQIESGDCLDECELLNRIAWLNQNPFHYTTATLAPGRKKGSTNIEVVTKDRFPLRIYAGGDNTGVESTGTSRFFGGVTWGDAFFVDDLLTYQFTSNINYDKFHNHLLNYTSYLPWKHIFMLYGGYSRIEVDVPDFKRSGKAAQASFRYKMPFKPYYTEFQHQFYFGFDYKYETSALFFVAELDFTEISNTIVNVTQEMAGYLMEYSSRSHQSTFQFEVYGSPFQWLPHQSSQDYNRLRAHAKPYYLYGTITLGDIYTFANRTSIAALFRAQGATGALVPSEQFKLGGYNSVRGYEESVFISDNGMIVNLEFRSRPFHFFKKAQDQLTLLAFMDYGWGYNYYPFDGIKKSASLWGVGPGVRYNISSYLNFRADYGFKLHSVKFDDNTLGMFHVGATLSY